MDEIDPFFDAEYIPAGQCINEEEIVDSGAFWLIWQGAGGIIILGMAA